MTQSVYGYIVIPSLLIDLMLATMGIPKKVILFGNVLIAIAAIAILAK